MEARGRAARHAGQGGRSSGGGGSGPHLQVACAIIEHGGRVLATQRSATMSLPLKWEFPGGKIRDGESPEGCLRRELHEELGICAPAVEALAPSTHHYEAFSVTLHPFRCAEPGGPITLHEHAASAWLAPEDLLSLDWAEADLPVIAQYLARRGGGRRARDQR